MSNAHSKIPDVLVMLYLMEKLHPYSDTQRPLMYWSDQTIVDPSCYAMTGPNLGLFHDKKPLDNNAEYIKLIQVKRGTALQTLLSIQ